VSAFARVTLRRLLGPWFLALALLLGWLAARGTGVGSAELDAATHALARTQVWSVLLVLAPFLVHASARLARPAEARAWLPGGAARAALAGGTVLGAFAAAAVLCLALALAGELALGRAQASQRLCARAPTPAGVRHADAPPARWHVVRPAAASHARLALGLVPGDGPSAHLRWTVRDGAQTRALEARLAGRGWLALELPPPASGTLECVLERLGGGAPVVLGPEALELLAPAGSERRATAAFASHALLALWLVLGMALVLAHALPPLLASLLALASFGLLARHAGGPAGALLEAWHELGLGRVPAWPEPASLALGLGTGALVVLFLAGRLGRGAPTP